MTTQTELEALAPYANTDETGTYKGDIYAEDEHVNNE
jgi:hypothetical protein